MSIDGKTRHQHPTGRSGTTSRPPQIRPHHRRKLAVVYVRTSALAPDDAQRALVAVPRSWGWPTSRIRIIDRDVWRRGTSVAERPGFQRMRALIHRGQVGLVVVRDVSRLSRDPIELCAFLTEAKQAGVVVLAIDRVIHTLTPESLSPAE